MKASFNLAFVFWLMLIASPLSCWVAEDWRRNAELGQPRECTGTRIETRCDELRDARHYREVSGKELSAPAP